VESVGSSQERVKNVSTSVMLRMCLFIDLVPDPCSFEPDSEVAELAEQMKTLLETAEPTDDCIQLPTALSVEDRQLEVSQALETAGLKIGDRVLVGGMKVSALLFCYMNMHKHTWSVPHISAS